MSLAHIQRGFTLKRNSWENGNTQFIKRFFTEYLPKPNRPDMPKFHLIFRDLEWMFSGTHVSVIQSTCPQSHFPKGNVRTCGCPSCYGDKKALRWSSESRARGMHSQQVQELEPCCRVDSAAASPDTSKEAWRGGQGGERTPCFLLKIGGKKNMQWGDGWSKCNYSTERIHHCPQYFRRYQPTRKLILACL